MIVLSVQHIAKAFGGTDVLKDASLTLQQRERIGPIPERCACPGPGGPRRH